MELVIECYYHSLKNKKQNRKPWFSCLKAFEHSVFFFVGGGVQKTLLYLKLGKVIDSSQSPTLSTREAFQDPSGYVKPWMVLSLICTLFSPMQMY